MENSGIPAQRLAVLHAAHRELLRREERARVSGHHAAALRQADDELHPVRTSLLAADLRQRRVGLELRRIPLERRGAAQRSAVELRLEALQRAVGRERHLDARVAREVEAERRPEASRAAVRRDLAEQAGAAVAYGFRAVGDAEARPAGPEEREREPQRSARACGLPEVRDRVLRLRAVERHRHGGARLVQRRIGVRELQVVDVSAVLPVDRAALALAEQVRLVEADESAEPRALPHGSAEVHVARALLLHLEHDVDVALVVRRSRLRKRQGRLEEPEVLDAAVAVDQPLLVEHVAGNDRELVADAGLGRVVVAEDLDAIDDRGRAFLDFPAEVHARPRIGLLLVDDRAHLRVDVSFVRVRVLDLARGLRPISRRRTRPSAPIPPLTSAVMRCVSVGPWLAERIQVRDVLLREAPVSRRPRSCRPCTAVLPRRRGR